MKRFLIMVLAICLCVCMVVSPVFANGNLPTAGGSAGGGEVAKPYGGTVPGNAVASGECGNSCFWYIVGDTLTVTGSGEMTANSYHLAPWAGYNQSIKAVVIEDGITKISDFCFTWHYALETVQLGKDVKVIGSNAFIGCDNLSNINLPEGLEEIGYQAFSGCSKLSGVALPESVKKIGNDAFDGIADYKDASNWSDGVFYLGTYAVSENPDNIPEKVIIREGTLKISQSINLSDAKVVVIPASVIGFDSYTFHESIIIEGVLDSGAQKSAEDHCFLFFEIGKPHIVTESFGAGFSWTLDADKRWLTISGNGDTGNFRYNEAPWHGMFNYVDTVELKNGITALGTEALLYFDEIKLMVPDSVTEIRCDVNNKTVIYGNPDSYAERFAAENGLLFETPDGNVTSGGKLSDTVSWKFSQNQFTLTITGNGSMPDFESFYDAPWYAFREFIDEIIISEGITYIGNNSFNCSSKQNTWVSMPESVESIGSSAFAGTKILYCPEGSFAAAWAGENAPNYEIYGEYQEIRVENSDELLEALGSNRKLILADGLYETSDKIRLEYIRDLVIEAEHSGYAEILSRDGYRPVMEFFCCKDISVSGLILGHTSLSYQEGNCGGNSVSSGYVVECDHSSDINISACDLYGCGTIAVMMNTAYGVSLDDCVLRDCKENIITNTNEYTLDRKTYMDTYVTLQLTDCVISGNAYDEAYAESTPAINLYASMTEFKDCIFINNQSEKRELYTQSTEFENCIFKDNVWQGESPKDYGICLGGITWKVTQGENGYVLHLGFPIEYEDGTIIESAKGITIPYSQYSIPWRKFENEGFEAIKLADGVKLGGKCGKDVYWELSEEGVLTLHGNGKMSFYDYLSPWYNYYRNIIKSVVVQSGVESIAQAAFNGCVKISSVNFAEGLLEIGESAFSSCWNIQELNIPASVTSIAGNAFAYCEGIKAINVSSESKSYSSNNGVLFTRDGSGLIIYPSGKIAESYIVPDGTAEIGSAAFSANYNLKSLSLPASLTKIGIEAFTLYEIQSITVAEGNSSFADDEGVLFNKDKTKLIYYPSAKPELSYEVPSGVKEFEVSAIQYPKNLLKLVLPDSIEAINDGNLFGMNECTFVCKKDSYAYDYLSQWGYAIKENDNFMAGRIRNLDVTVQLPENRAVNGYVLITVYDWNNRITELKKIKVTNEDDVIEYTMKKRGNHAKVMWLDMDGKLTPLSEFIERD